MHIVIVPSWYPINDEDIGGSFFKEQAIALQNSGVRITVAYVETRSLKRIVQDFICRNWSQGYIYSNQELVEYRFRIYNYLMKIPNGKEFLIYRKLKKLFSYIEKNEEMINLIHLHSFLSHGYAVNRLARKKGLKFVITEHFTGFSRNVLKKYQKKNLKNLLKNAEKIIAVGPGLQKDLQEYTQNPVEIIPNMVDVTQYKLKYMKNEKRFRFLSIGSLVYKKGFDLLIKAFSLFHSFMEESELLIVGEGSEHFRLKGLISDYSLDDCVFLYGKAGRDKIPEIMVSCHSFILTSRHETFGVVLIEAMAAGRPVIATDNQGPLSIITPETGILAKSEDIKDIASAMKNMFMNYENYNAEKIRQYCVENFSQDAVVKRIINVYNGILCH